MGRSAVSIIAGFALWTILWLAVNTILQNAFPKLYGPSGDPVAVLLVILLVLSALYSVVSGYVTAAMAERDPERHALYLGLVLLTVGLFVQIQNWNLAPAWFHVFFLGLLAPGTMLGGYLQATRSTPAPSDDSFDFRP